VEDSSMLKKKMKFEFNIWFYVLSSLLLISIICDLMLFFIKEKETVKYVTDQNIVFFGDSITEGYKVDEFFPDTFVINSGISGNKSNQLLERIENDVYAYNPSKVFILIGINDMNHSVPEEEILNNIQKVINGIKINRKYTKIYIESIYPINRNMFDDIEYGFNKEVTNDKIKKINSKIKTMCEDNDINYVDVYSSLTDTNGNLKAVYSKEGLHLTDLGYFKVTKVLEKYISE
jgi:lysophospholipase L1-like esterase